MPKPVSAFSDSAWKTGSEFGRMSVHEESVTSVVRSPLLTTPQAALIADGEREHPAEFDRTLLRASHVCLPWKVAKMTTRTVDKPLSLTVPATGAPALQ